LYERLLIPSPPLKTGLMRMELRTEAAAGSDSIFLLHFLTLIQELCNNGLQSSRTVRFRPICLGMNRMRSYSAVVLGAAAVLVASLLFDAPSLAAQTAAPAPAPQGNARMHHPMPKPTNLQVLPKDISPKELMSIMGGFKKALGVECSFCHVDDPQTHRMNFASDAKPDKNIARTMIRMTEEINGKYVSTIHDPDATPAEKTVTCGTCHRGHMMPVPFVAANAKQGHPSAPGKPE
jgi:Photosynthetic reaction centre cytochrome C subunit